MSRGPASVIVDSAGNLVGVVLDGTTYRLQVEAKIIGGVSGVSADVVTEGTRNAQSIEYPELLAAVERIGARLDTVCAQLAAITDERDPL